MADTFIKDEYFALVKSIADLDQRLLTIKGWGVTLSLAALGLAFQYRAYGFFLVAAASSAAFWIIEHSVKRHQMRHYVRMREVEVWQHAQAAADDKRFSSPRMDWSWHKARKTLLKGTVPDPTDPVLPRSKSTWYEFAWALPHVAFPHVLTFVIGIYYFHQGVIGQLLGFTLGASK